MTSIFGGGVLSQHPDQPLRHRRLMRVVYRERTRIGEDRRAGSLKPIQLIDTDNNPSLTVGALTHVAHEFEGLEETKKSYPLRIVEEQEGNL